MKIKNNANLVDLCGLLCYNKLVETVARLHKKEKKKMEKIK